METKEIYDHLTGLFPDVELQLDEEAGPHLVADRDGSRAGGQRRHDVDGVLGLRPGPEREHRGSLGHPRRLELRDHHGGVAVASDDVSDVTTKPNRRHS